MSELQLFSATKCSDFSGKLWEGEQIYCIGGTRADIFLGSNLGRLLLFRLEEGKYTFCGSRCFRSKKAITTVEIVTALNQLFIICGFEFLTASLDSPDNFKTTHIQEDVMRFAINVNPTTEDPFVIPIAFALSRQGMIVTEVSKRGMNKRIYFDTAMGVRNLSYSRNTVCYASEQHYLVVNMITKQTIRVFQHDCPTPTISPVGPDEFLVRSSSGLSIFVNGDGTSSRPPCVLSTEKGPLFYKEPHIINCSRIKVAIQDCCTQHLEEFAFEQINTVNYIEGQIMLVNKKSELYTVGETPTEDTISALIERQDYAQAVSVLEKSLGGNNDEAIIQKIVEYSDKSAIMEIKSYDFETAALHVFKRTMDVSEILEKLWKQEEEIGDKLYHFVKYLMMKIRFADLFSSQKQVIDTELLRVCYHLKCEHELDYIAGFRPEPLGGAEIFMKHNEMRKAAELLFDGLKYEEAIPLFIRVGVVYGAAHLYPLMFKLHRLPFSSELIPFFSLLAPYFPVEIAELLIAKKCSVNVAHYILRGLPSWETFLERQTLNEEIAIELTVSYIAGVENDDNNKKRKLRSLLLNAEETTIDKIKVFLTSEKFKLEAEICEAKIIPISVLEKLLAVEDFESAELLSAKFSKSHPEVALRLLKEYLNDKNHTASTARIGSLLAHVGSNFNPEELLTILPDHMKLSELASFLKSSLIHKNKENDVKMLQLAANEKQAERFFQLKDKSQCFFCSKSLEYMEPLVILPTQHVMHNQCYANLFPVLTE